MQQKLFSSALATGAVAMCLFMGASTALATTVILNGDSVVGIEDLAVTNQLGFTTVYDVDFLVTTAIDLYGPTLVPQLKDENAMLGRIAITDVLNPNIPLPKSAGPDGDFQFFIGAFVEEVTMVSVGGEFESRNPNEWGWCRAACLPFGVKVLLPDQFVTFASFTEAGVIPVPASFWLFGSGLVGLVGIARRKKA